MKKSLLLLMLLFEAIAHAQVVNICTNPAAQAVLLGRYNPYGYHATGTYIYTLVADGRPLSSRRMVFTE